MKLKEIMSQPVVTVNTHTTLEAVAGIMLLHNIGCVPVVDDRAKVVGIITHMDFIAKEEAIPFSRVRIPKLLGQSLREETETIYQAARTMTAAEIMTDHPLLMTEEDLVKTFLERIIDRNITHAPVVRGDLLVGIVAKHDLLKMVTKEVPTQKISSS